MTAMEGRCAIVTGAGMGIGEAVAHALAAAGAAVVAFDRDDGAVRDTAAAIERAGGRCRAVAGDVRRAGDAEAAVAAACEGFGRLDGVANMAGVIREGAAPDCDEETWDLVLDTNLKGTFLLSRAAVPELRKHGGAIVNAASVLAFAAVPERVAYCASKGGIVALTTAMALDHAHEGVRVNCIAPGSVRTPLLVQSVGDPTGAELEQAMEEVARSHPAGKVIEPDEVAQLVVFLLSDAASAITGGCHRVDHGLLAKLGL